MITVSSIVPFLEHHQRAGINQQTPQSLKDSWELPKSRMLFVLVACRDTATSVACLRIDSGSAISNVETGLRGHTWPSDCEVEGQFFGGLEVGAVVDAQHSAPLCLQQCHVSQPFRKNGTFGETSQPSLCQNKHSATTILAGFWH